MKSLEKLEELSPFSIIIIDLATAKSKAPIDKCITYIKQ